jgi:DNA-binding NarL/FixJ family response regulator
MKKVIIIEDDFVVGGLIKDNINKLEGYFCENVFLNPVLYLNANVQCDILLLDVVMPEMNGLEAIDLILKKYPQVSIIMNTIKDDDETIITALKKGAIGYIDKQSFDMKIQEVLNTISNGGGYMTPAIASKVIANFNKSRKYNESLSSREKEIAESILDGLSYKMIALRYNIAIDTVRMHIKSIYKKLQINSKGELFSLSKF